MPHNNDLKQRYKISKTVTVKGMTAITYICSLCRPGQASSGRFSLAQPQIHSEQMRTSQERFTSVTY